MTPNPFRGLSGSPTPRGRRSRELFPLRSIQRQTRGHNLLNNLVDTWPLCEQHVGGASPSTCQGLYGNLLLGPSTLANGAGNGPTLATAFANGGALLSRASQAEFQVGGGQSFTVAAWAYFNSLTNGIIVCKDSAVAGGREYSLYWSVTPLWRFSVGDIAGTFATNFAYIAGTPTLNTWYFMVGRYDVANSIINVNVNAGAVVNFNGTFGATGPISTATPFYVGCDGRGGNTAGLDGRIQRVAMWRRVLTDDEITYLYNGGFGRDYPWI